MALYPDVQRKAQAQLDSVVGPERLPEYEDLDNMPYVRAVMLETLRWMPVSPFGIPHALTEDDEYDGYHIPGGSIVLAVSTGYYLTRVVVTLSDACVEYLVSSHPPLSENLRPKRLCTGPCYVTHKTTLIQSASCQNDSSERTATSN